MGDKKDPGKFTIRFNIADPQQQAVAELLNRQGRYKAQFITNAVMFYVHATPALLSTDAEFRHIIASPLQDTGDAEITAGTGNRRDADSETGIAGADMDSIRRTMDAFNTQ